MEGVDPIKRGFTLLELLTCVAIVFIVSAIAFPVFGAAKRSAKRSAAQNNLRQLYIAVSLYRTDNNGDGAYGAAEHMGLPADTPEKASPYVAFMNQHNDFKKSPCGLNRSWYQPYSWEPDSGPEISIIYRPSDWKTFGDYASLYRSNALLFYDVNCDDPDSPIYNPSVRHRGLAVLVEGRLVHRYQPGLMLDHDSWWSSPEGQ